jgi:nucleoid-associated protein YgaU
MKFRSFGCFVLGVVVLMGTGCSKVKFYAVDRPRVDQATMGNAGYVGGQNKGATSVDGRPTRRIYVFEVDRKKKEEVASVSKANETASQTPQAAEDKQATDNPPKQGLSLPYIGDDEPASDGTGAMEAATEVAGAPYTVVKDDTLQKISKKVYGSYSKWTKIYDANKDKIKNPNFVKPGIVIIIPPVD